MKEQKVFEINSVEICNKHFGLPTQNPMISIIDFSQFERIEHIPKRFNIYAIFLSFSGFGDAHINDTIVATISFYSPGQYGQYNSGVSLNPKGLLLIFDEKITKDTIFESRIRDFGFFNSTSNNTIGLSQKEVNMVLNCMRSIEYELNNEIDYYTPRILTSGIAVLLSLSMRYYDRHNKPTGGKGRKNIVAMLNTILDEYLRKPASKDKEIPSVSTIAKQMGITPNYLGDIVRRHAQRSAHDYIRGFIMKEAKRQLIYTNIAINAIAYNMGYKYPHHFTRVFKQEYGITPNEYRTMYQAAYIDGK